MSPDALEAVRSRYKAAYEAYQLASKRVAQKLANGLVPSTKDVEDETNATERLTAARRELIDAMTRL